MDVTRVKRRIEETRLDGYCIHHRAGSLEKALAVPIIRNYAFQGALTMRYIPSAVSYTELKNRYVAPLLELAKVIAAKLSVS